jgi:hypothetical protein
VQGANRRTPHCRPGFDGYKTDVVVVVDWVVVVVEGTDVVVDDGGQRLLRLPSLGMIDVDVDVGGVLGTWDLGAGGETSGRPGTTWPE